MSSRSNSRENPSETSGGNRSAGNQLIFEEVVEGLTVAALFFGTSATALLLNEHFAFKIGTDVVGALVGHPDLDRLHTFVTRRGIEMKAIPAGETTTGTASEKAVVCRDDEEGSAFLSDCPLGFNSGIGCLMIC